jgi:hypothetical protein
MYYYQSYRIIERDIYYTITTCICYNIIKIKIEIVIYNRWHIQIYKRCRA